MQVFPKHSAQEVLLPHVFEGDRQVYDAAKLHYKGYKNPQYIDNVSHLFNLSSFPDLNLGYWLMEYKGHSQDRGRCQRKEGFLKEVILVVCHSIHVVFEKAS